MKLKLEVEVEVDIKEQLETGGNGEEKDLIGIKPSRAERAIVITDGRPKETIEVKEKKEESSEADIEVVVEVEEIGRGRGRGRGRGQGGTRGRGRGRGRRRSRGREQGRRGGNTIPGAKEEDNNVGTTWVDKDDDKGKDNDLSNSVGIMKSVLTLIFIFFKFSTIPKIRSSTSSSVLKLNWKTQKTQKKN